MANKKYRSLKPDCGTITRLNPFCLLYVDPRPFFCLIRGVRGRIFVCLYLFYLCRNGVLLPFSPVLRLYQP